MVGIIVTILRKINTVFTNLSTTNTNVLTVDTVVDRIEVDTTSIETKVDTVDTVVDAIKLKTDLISSAICPTKPRVDGLDQSATISTYYTLTNVSGVGILNKVKLGASYSIPHTNLKLRVTVDGVINNLTLTSATSHVDYGTGSLVFHYIFVESPVYFTTSLKIEIMQDYGGPITINSSSYYSLV